MDSVAEAVEYREIEGFPGYRVGTDGSVWSCWRQRPLKGRRIEVYQGGEWRKMKLRAQAHGYLGVTLCRDKKHFTRLVHRLVLEAFRGPCPDGMEACHDPDPDPANCRLDNLRWDTHASNHADKRKHGTWQGGERHGMAKLTVADVRTIKARLRAGDSRDAVAADFRLCKQTVARIDRGDSWGHVA